MSYHYFLNEDKTYRPCNLHEWAMQFREIDRHVGDDIVDNCRVSTVWLGLDNNYFEEPPLVFETMVFDAEKHGSDIYSYRYTTWDEAIEGHKKAIQWVLDGCVDDESR